MKKRKKYMSDYWIENKLKLKAANINKQLLIFHQASKSDQAKELDIRDNRIAEFIRQTNNVNK